MLTVDQINALSKRVEELKGYLGVEQKRMEIAEDEKLTQDPEFWNDPKEAEKVMKRMRTKKSWVQAYDDCASAVDDLSVLYEFMKAGEEEESEVDKAFEAASTAVEELEFKNMLSAEEDSLNAVMQITSGAGGTESCDWASMLMRMYRMYGDKNGFKVKELDLQDGEVAGIKQVTMEFDGDFAFGMLKGENGVHRLVRISPFDSNARRHTSFVSVYVYPLVDDTIEIHVNPGRHLLGNLPFRRCRWPKRQQGGDGRSPAPRADRHHHRQHGDALAARQQGKGDATLEVAALRDGDRQTQRGPR